MPNCNFKNHQKYKATFNDKALLTGKQCFNNIYIKLNFKLSDKIRIIYYQVFRKLCSIKNLVQNSKKRPLYLAPFEQ